MVSKRLGVISLKNNRGQLLTIFLLLLFVAAIIFGGIWLWNKWKVHSEEKRLAETIANAPPGDPTILPMTRIIRGGEVVANPNLSNT